MIRFRELGTTLVVVTYNSANVLRDFLRTLPAAATGISDLEVIIVDNASTDGTCELASGHGMVTKVIQLGANRGYAAGINAGVSASPHRRAYLVLNPDVRLMPGCIQRLWEALSTRGVGICVPRLVDEHGNLLFSLRRAPSLSRELGEALLGGRRVGRWSRLGHVISDPEAYDAPASAAWATGGAMLISHECFFATGPWDERFFLYEEEVDFCLRAADAGFALRYVPEARAERIIGSGPSAYLWALMRVNRLRLYRSRHGIIKSTLMHLVLTFGEVLRAIRGRQSSRIAVRALLSRRSIRDQPQRVIALGADPSPRKRSSKERSLTAEHD